MRDKCKVLVVGCGNMGASHAIAYHNHPGFDICGLVSRGQSKNRLVAKLGKDYALYDDFDEALRLSNPEAVCISTYPDTHHLFAMKALQRDCHVFVEKPLAPTLQESREIVEEARKRKKTLVVGYILRHHATWKRFVEESHKLGKPLVMRMNLNQQSQGYMWDVHRNLMQSLSPIVDCGVHYLDVMCQMTRCRPIQVSAMGVRLTDEIPEDNYNYGQLQVWFEDGSVGWYEAGWGPMMSENAFFIKDVIGPKGSASIVSEEGLYKEGSDDIDRHTKSNTIQIHHGALDKNNSFHRKDEFIRFDNDPSHQELCDAEQAFFYDAIVGKEDLESHWEDAVNSLALALACDKSVKTQNIVRL